MYHYVSGSNGLAAIMVRNGAAQDSLYYTYNDFQGNLLAVTDAAGTVKERYAYDPYGHRVNPTNWRVKDTRQSFIFARGYTMHEHLDNFGLINMNGRMYDPLMGQFLSPDSYVQAPGNWYNYNRYSYCFNNPLIYIDEDGELAWFVPIIFAVVYAGIEYGTQVYQNYQINKQLEAAGRPDLKMSSKDMWLRRIDWFDVGVSGVAGFFTPIFPAAAPYIRYVTPVVHNAFNWYGNGEFQTVFDGSIDLKHFAINTMLDLATTYLTNKLYKSSGIWSSSEPRPEYLFDNFKLKSIEEMMYSAVNSFVEYNYKPYLYIEYNRDKFEMGPPLPPDYWNIGSLFQPKFGIISKTNNRDKSRSNWLDLEKYLRLNLIPVK